MSFRLQYLALISRYDKVLKANKVLPLKEQLELLAIIRNPECSDALRTRTKEKLVLTNIKLVISIVRKHYFVKCLTADDLFAVGVHALSHAIDLWRPEKSALSTYANLWIDGSIKRYIHDNDCAVIDLPVTITQGKLRLLKIYDKYGEDVSEAIIREELGYYTKEDLSPLFTDYESINFSTPVQSSGTEDMTFEETLADSKNTAESIEAVTALEQLRLVLGDYLYGYLMHLHRDGKSWAELREMYGKNPSHINKDIKKILAKHGLSAEDFI